MEKTVDLALFMRELIGFSRQSRAKPEKSHAKPGQSPCKARAKASHVTMHESVPAFVPCGCKMPNF